MKMSAFEIKLQEIESAIKAEYAKILSDRPCFGAFGCGECGECDAVEDCKEQSFATMKSLEAEIVAETPVAETPVAETPVAEIEIDPAKFVPVVETPVVETEIDPAKFAPVAETPVAKKTKKKKGYTRVAFDFEKAIEWLLNHKPSSLKESAHEFNKWVGPGHRAIIYHNCRKMFERLQAHGILTYDINTKLITWIER